MTPRTRPLLRRLPLIALILGTALAAYGLRGWISLDQLAANRAALLDWRAAHPLLAPVTFVAVYAVMVTLSVPGATLATLTGGFLFGLFPGVLYNVAGASIGAVLVFAAFRLGLGSDIEARLAASGGRAERALAALRRNQWSALLTLRLVPVVPFFLANLLPAMAGIRLVPFALTTLVGILPGALVYTSVGSGLSDILARGEVPDPGLIFTPPVLLPLLGLAALAALPMLIGVFRRKAGHADT